uniref:Uncharacterized protein n=1 Tax=Siphovirus contig89 TaxID=1518022 RepID=A0A075EHT9_9CAUD|nr:hypothetical protein [Siphovirus contig89]AIE38431.1 hypothetical protein [Siphovirus contig89]AIE38474.1 hypothetical protein [Siphovirus contig89]AIE38517.1 hypothetical protein [Siphovirus contig89]AIE38560.1 hypothetical protein [Siphovirus contig89]
MGYILDTLGPGNKSGCTFIGATLVLPLQCGDAIVYLGLFVVEIMLLGINNNHGVTNSPGQFIGTGTLESHVSNKIGYLTHLGLSIRHPLHPRVARICSLGVESLQSLEWSGGTNPGLSLVGNYQDGVAIKISTAKTLSDRRMDPNSIPSIAKNTSRLLTSVVNSERRNLESPAMRITHETNNVTVPIVRSIYLTLLEMGHRQ